MKRILVVFVLFFLILLVGKNIFAQTAPTPTPASSQYAAAYQDYLNKTGYYQSAYNDYLVARSAYQASGSLDSTDKAIAATLKMLQSRDDVVTSYLNSIRTKVQLNQGISAADQSNLIGQLNNEISWYNNHHTKLTSAASLNDLVSDSDDAKTQYTSSTTEVIYLSLIDLGIGNNSFARSELTTELNTLNAKISQIKSNQDKDVTSIERSMVDIQNKLARSVGKDQDALSLVTGIKSTDQNSSGTFQDSQTDLTDSNLYLQDSVQGMLQVITQIKTAN